jgi:predicted AAA+ superfamily ATPase
MFRTGINSLQKWFSGSKRKPIVLRGARQVGKSTLVRMFAEELNIELIEINLEKHLYLDKVFSTRNIETILKEIEGLTGKRASNKTLLFLDEIQSTPEGISALRYFYEDRPEIPVIATGSLLEFTLSNHSFSMPVGRIEYRHLAPMSFNEFLIELDPPLAEQLRTYDLNSKFPNSLHHRLLEKQREYFFVGGMPEAVEAYSKSKSFENVKDVHNSICDTYLNDFSKYAQQKQLALMQSLFRKIPRSLGQKVKYSFLSGDHRSAEVKQTITLLSHAKLCQMVYSSNCSGLPLNADINERALKLYWLDVGLANHICGMDWLAISKMNPTNLVNEGAMAEQYIAQHLLIEPNMNTKSELVYWLRENKSANAEVDFVISRGNWIIPLEVKAAKSGSLKSLHQFMWNKSSPIAIRIDLNPPSKQIIETSIRTSNGTQSISYPLISIPAYAIEKLDEIIEIERKKHTDYH